MCCFLFKERRKTKFQDVIFTIIMVIVMVYAMVCYNVAIAMSGLNNQVFLEALKELPIMGAIAFILEFLIIGRIVKNITFKLLKPEKTQPIFITLLISALTVAFMCPIMSFIASLLFNYSGPANIIVNWFQTAVLNFPMALC